MKLLLIILTNTLEIGLYVPSEHRPDRIRAHLVCRALPEWAASQVKQGQRPEAGLSVTSTPCWPSRSGCQPAVLTAAKAVCLVSWVTAGLGEGVARGHSESPQSFRVSQRSAVVLVWQSVDCWKRLGPFLSVFLWLFLEQRFSETYW